MNRLTYWLYVTQEISLLKDAFAEVFEVADFDRDYENVWEWIEGTSTWLNAGINIRREHNWQTGEYDKPLWIWVTYEQKPSDKQIEEIGLRLSQKFNQEVFFGELDYVWGGDYQFDVQANFKP